MFLVMATAGGFVFLNYFLPSNSITADVLNPEKKELIQDGDFSKTATFSSISWRRLSNGGNVPEVKNNLLDLTIVSSKTGSYQLIGQPVALQKGMTYEINIDFQKPDKSDATFAALAGFTDLGIINKSIFSENLDLSKADKSTFTAKFSPEENLKNGYFFLKEYGGAGKLQISKISVTEQQATVKPVATQTALSSSVPAATATTVSSPTAVPTVIPTSTPTAKPITTPIAIKETTPLQSATIVIPSGWSFVGFPWPINTTSFTAKNLKVYRMLGTDWQIASSQNKTMNFTTLPQDGLYVYNSKGSEVSIEVNEVAAPERAQYPVPGWNLLYNGKDRPTAMADLTINLQKGSSTVADLITQNKASKLFYYLKQTSQGVALVNNEFDKDSVPAKTAYWIYLF